MERQNRVVFSAAGLAHEHIYQMCDGLLAAGAELKYVYDADERLVKKFIKSFPQAKIADSEEQIMADKEVALIASADIPSRRAALGIRSMRAGKDFFTAKAPVVTEKQLNAVKKTVKATGKKFFVFYSEFLQSEAAVYADTVIKQGMIGRVLNVVILAPHKLGEGRPSWFYKRKDTGGILIDIGSHQFEQFLTFSGNEKAKILSSAVANYAHGNAEEFDDFGEAHLLGENGATCYIRVDWFTPPSFPVFGDGKVVIVGEKGFIELRKYIDIGCGEQTENVIIATDGKTDKFSVKDKIKKPFFENLLADCRNRTDTAMPMPHAFYAMSLAIDAQKRAKRIRVKR